MTTKQRTLVYAFAVFMLAFGFDIINNSIMHEPGEQIYHFSPFDITFVMYVVFTLLLVRVLLVKLYPQKKVLLAIGLLLMFPAFIFFRYFLEEMMMPIIINKSNYVDSITFTYYCVDNITYALYYIIIGVLLFMLDYNIAHQQKIKQLEIKNKEAELDNLRAQLNPHFLFNSLNNIYTLVSEKSDNAADAVMRLSDITRYLIYEKSNTCEVRDEIKQTENYIQLQQLRFAHDLTINNTVTGLIEGKQIPPFTLVTFIENAFKHGDFRDTNIPLNIKVHGESKRLTISVSNKIGQLNKDSTSGVGLSNIRNRLQLIFPNAHRMITRSENNIFTVELTIEYP